jgi:MFS transporter, DHA1 family, tetracycline resistance protein
MNEQTSQASPGKLDFKRVMPVFVLVLVDVLGLSVIIPLLHLYAAAYGASPLEIGLVAAAFPLAQLIGVPVMGALSDRFGRKPLLLISQVTTCLSFIMLGLANSLALVILSRVIDGLFGANLATAQAALSDITDEENRAQALGLTGAAFGLGFIFGPITALIGLAISDSLAVPAMTAAVYSFASILLTLFVFKETLPPEKRGQRVSIVTPLVLLRMLRNPNVNLLLLLMFAQQAIFFGFESLLGLFTLSRLGMLGQGNTLLFLVVGVVLVIVQVRFIGKWSRKYGDHWLVRGALGLLAFSLVMVALTPQQPQPFYVPERVRYELAQQVQADDNTEAIIGEFEVQLPPAGNNGLAGIFWLLIAIVPLSVGAGLIRPSLNSLMTKRTPKQEYGAILGVSAAFVSAANAIAPLLGGWLFQQYGSTLPFLLGGVLMLALFALSLRFVQPAPAT